MQYLLLIYGSEMAWDKIPKDELGKMYGEYTAFTKAIAASGNYIGGNPLQPTSTATTVRVRDGKRSVTDGPFAETKELVAGFWIWQVRNIEEAVEWLKRSPFGPGAELEIRPIFEAADFGAHLTPELKAHQDHLREQVADKQSSKPRKKSFDALSIL